MGGGRGGGGGGRGGAFRLSSVGFGGGVASSSFSFGLLTAPFLRPKRSTPADALGGGGGFGRTVFRANLGGGVASSSFSFGLAAGFFAAIVLFLRPNRSRRAADGRGRGATVGCDAAFGFGLGGAGFGFGSGAFRGLGFGGAFFTIAFFARLSSGFFVAAGATLFAGATFRAGDGDGLRRPKICISGGAVVRAAHVAAARGAAGTTKACEPPSRKQIVPRRPII
jgi:hypothetical protein